MNNYYKTLIGVCLLACGLTGVRADDVNTSGLSTLEVAVATAQVHGFTEILRNSGLGDLVTGNKPITLLLPVDVSFYKLTPEGYAKIFDPAQKELAIAYVKAHVVQGAYSLDQLAQGGVKTLNGTPLVVTKEGKNVFINGVQVFSGDKRGTNGWAHFLSGFLLPGL